MTRERDEASLASDLQAFRQGDFVAAVAMLGQVPQRVGLCVHPHRIPAHGSLPDAGWNPESHGAGRDVRPRGDDSPGPDERT